MYDQQNVLCFFFFKAEGGIRYLVRSRGLGDVYKRQPFQWPPPLRASASRNRSEAQLHVQLCVQS